MTSLLRGGLTGIFLGAPGTGKSHLLGTASEVPGISSPLLLAPKPREINSAKYREHGITEYAEVFSDAGWAPAIESYEFGAFKDLYRRVLELYDDEQYDCVLLDPFTDVPYLAAHELLAPERVETPRDLRDSIGFYGALKYKLKGFTQSLVGLASPTVRRPKHIFVAVHVQPAKEEDVKGKKTVEADARGIEFFGDVLPMIEGGYRREIAGEFDVVGFTMLKHENVREGNRLVRQSRFVVQLNADSEKHAKMALLPRLDASEIPNNLPALFQLIESETPASR